MKTNHFFILIFLCIFPLWHLLFAQCNEGAIPRDYTAVTNDFFQNYTPPLAQAGTEVIEFNPRGGTTILPDGISLQVDGHGSIQVKQNGRRHYFNVNVDESRNTLADKIRGLSDETNNGFVVTYKGKAYSPENGGIRSSENRREQNYYKNKSISQITGIGTTADPWKAKIEYYADINGNGRYEEAQDILIVEIITFSRQNNFFRRDRQVVPLSSETITVDNPIKLFEYRDAAFTEKVDAGYGVYSTGGIGRAKTPKRTTPELRNGYYGGSYIGGEIIRDNINFIGVTDKELGGDITKSVLLGFSEITPWRNWYIGFFAVHSYSPNEPGKFDLFRGEEPNNYMMHWHKDIGFGVMYENIVSNEKTTVSLYEAVTSPCLLSPQIIDISENQIFCEGEAVSVQPLSVTARPYSEGKRLSYQWYSNTSDSNVGGTPIVGATNAIYQPTEAPTLVKKLYYYVKISEEDGQDIISSPIEIAIIKKAVFVQQPADGVINCSTKAVKIQFKATFTPLENWRYQLEKQNGTNWEDVANATGSAMSGNVTDITLTDAQAGTYRIRLISPKDNDNCDHLSQSIKIELPPVIPTPTFAQPSVRFCISENKKVSDLAISSGINPTANILWYSSLTNDTALSENHILESGSYFAEASVNGCKSQRTELKVNIIKIEIPSVQIISGGCGNTQSIEFSGLPSGNWILKEINDKISVINGNTVTYSSGGFVNGEEYQFVVEAAGCQSEATPLITIPHTLCAIDDFFTIDANELTSSVLVNDLYDGSPLLASQVTISEEGNLPLGFTINSDGTISIGNVRQGTYQFSYKICADQVCSVASIIIEIENGYLDIEIPEYFTPDGNGINDTWGPKNTLQYPRIRTYIYDRHGRILAILAEGESWDGHYNGVRMPAGGYWYTIDLNSIHDKRKFFGHFTIF